MHESEKLMIGEHFNYKGIEWVCLDIIDGNYLAMTANIWQELPFDENGCNNWTESTLRYELNNEFILKLDKKHLVKYTPDLIADSGEKQYTKSAQPDYVFILSCDQYRKYRDVVPTFDKLVWTLTPWATSSRASYVRFVTPSGALGSRNACYGDGVAPACIFSSERLKLTRQVKLVDKENEQQKESEARHD